MTNRNVQKSQENTTSKVSMRTLSSQISQEKNHSKNNQHAGAPQLIFCSWRKKRVSFWCFLVFDQKKIWPLSLEGQSAYFEIWRGQNILILYEINDWTLTLVCHNSKPWLSVEKGAIFWLFPLLIIIKTASGTVVFTSLYNVLFCLSSCISIFHCC